MVEVHRPGVLLVHLQTELGVALHDMFQQPPTNTPADGGRAYEERADKARIHHADKPL